MKGLKGLFNFVRNGVSVFRDASSGNYRTNSGSVSEMREELFGHECSRADDKASLREDRRNVERDFCKAFNKYVLSNG